MRYENMEPAIFLERPNRFVAYVEQAGRREICHVKNTGRCRELLVPGAELYVQRSDNPARKTPLDLISVKKGEQWVNMDSQAPNRVFCFAQSISTGIPASIFIWRRMAEGPLWRSRA